MDSLTKWVGTLLRLSGRRPEYYAAWARISPRALDSLMSMKCRAKLTQEQLALLADLCGIGASPGSADGVRLLTRSLASETGTAVPTWRVTQRNVQDYVRAHRALLPRKVYFILRSRGSEDAGRFVFLDQPRPREVSSLYVSASRPVRSAVREMIAANDNHYLGEISSEEYWSASSGWPNLSDPDIAHTVEAYNALWGKIQRLNSEPLAQRGSAANALVAQDAA